MNKFVEVLSNSFFARFYRAISVFLEYIHYRKNPNKRKPSAPFPCQFCGQTDHTEGECPNLKKMGFLD